MVKAITSVFSESTHIICLRHRKQNLIHKLTDDAVTKSDGNIIVDRIFGNGGITNADDTCTIGFEEKCDHFEAFCAHKSAKFLKKYSQDHLRTQIKTKLNEPAWCNKIYADWTNNNSESVNHLLKLIGRKKNNKKKKNLTEIVYRRDSWSVYRSRSTPHLLGRKVSTRPNT